VEGKGGGDDSSAPSQASQGWLSWAWAALADDDDDDETDDEDQDGAADPTSASSAAAVGPLVFSKHGVNRSGSEALWWPQQHPWPFNVLC
jgi:hypothetical protein